MNGTMLTVTSGVSRGWNSLNATSEETSLTGGIETVGTVKFDAELKTDISTCPVRDVERLDVVSSVRFSRSSDRVPDSSRYGNGEMMYNIATMEHLRLCGRAMGTDRLRPMDARRNMHISIHGPGWRRTVSSARIRLDSSSRCTNDECLLGGGGN